MAHLAWSQASRPFVRLVYFGNMLLILKSGLRAALCDTAIWNIWQRRRDKRQIAAWIKAGKPIPPPSSVKRRILSNYGVARSLHCFVETGTLHGDTPSVLKDQFKAIYSIELSEELARKAVRRFRAYPNIHIVQGDSGECLAEIMNDISSPALIWLDGHYSAGITARSGINCPIVQELASIFSHSIKDHVILIDDARHFNGTNDYPTIEELRDIFARERPNYDFSVSSDLIRAVPGSPVADPF